MVRRFIFSFFLFIPSFIFATIFYVDPANGAINNDGSFNSPWSTLEAVFDANLIETQSYELPYSSSSQLIIKNAGAPVKAGDTILLRNGLHGRLFYRGAYNTNFITIMAQEGHTPIFSSIKLMSVSKWKLVNLSVSSEPYGSYFTSNMILIEKNAIHGPSSYVDVVNCKVYSGVNSTTWSQNDWLDRVGSGIQVKGNYMNVIDNEMTNIDNGINVFGDFCTIQNNQIINFAGDGIRAQGSDILVEGNLIKNCYDIDDNHDDGIQSFTTFENPYRRNIIRGNTIINYEDENQPLRGTLQGIGCFDGPYEDWIVENNLIVVDHFHGITFLGAFNCKIINNTVIDPTLTVTPGPAWIRIANHKDGTPSSGCVVKNNFANSFQVDAVSSNNITLTSFAEYSEHFVDYLANDFHLIPSSTAINSADDNVAPSIDIEGVQRPQGNNSDIGAFEYSGALSISDFDVDSHIEIYPNPVNNILSVSITDMSYTEIKAIEIFSVLGKLVYTEPKVNLDRNLLKINIKNLKPGIYFLRINKDSVSKFIKIRF